MATGTTQGLVVGIINEKGGVGKTTTAITLGAGLAREGYRVVLVDCDPQGHICEYLGMDREAALFDLLVNDKPVGRLLRKAPREAYLRGGEGSEGALYVLPGNYRTASAGHVLTAENRGSDTLRKKLDTIIHSVDFILLDTSPTVTMLMANVYNAIDAMVIPTELEEFSRDGVRNALARLETARKSRPHIALLGILPVKYRGSTAEHPENLALLVDDYDGVRLFGEDGLVDKEALKAYKFGGMVWKPITDGTIWPETTRFKSTIFCAPGKTARAAIRAADALTERFLASLQKLGVAHHG